MEDLCLEMISAVEAGAFQLALFGALTLPDICSSLEASNGETNRLRYIAWWDRELGSRYRPPRTIQLQSGMHEVPGLNGATAYKLRCRILHQHRSVLADTKLTTARIIFVLPNSMSFHQNSADDVYMVDLSMFVRDVADATIQWLQRTQGSEPFETNYSAGLKLRPEGLSPYLTGLPIS